MKAHPVRLTLLAVLCGVPASAQLVLNVDTAHRRLWFTSSDLGSPDGEYGVAWEQGSGSFTTFDLGELISSSNSGFSSLTLLIEQSGASSLIKLELYLNDPAATTLSGLGSSTTFDYSSIGSTAISTLEGAIGTSLTEITGTDFSAIAIVDASAVPEPATWAAIAGALALAGTMLARCRQHRTTSLA